MHGVATLAAKKARLALARRKKREQSVVEPVDRETRTAAPDADLASVLDEELRRLPENLRLAIVYCELREFTIAQASKELGWPIGTVASRLSRGRSMLADRLRRRGAAPALAVVGVGLVTRSAVAEVSRKLIAKTVSTSLAGGAGSSATVMSLTTEVVRTMFFSKIRVLCVGLIAAAAIVVPGFQVLRTSEAAPVPKATQNAPAEDPLSRFKIENLSGLLRVEAVRNEVKITAEQQKKLDELRQKTIADRRNGFKVRAMGGGTCRECCRPCRQECPERRECRPPEASPSCTICRSTRRRSPRGRRTSAPPSRCGG